MPKDFLTFLLPNSSIHLEKPRDWERLFLKAKQEEVFPLFYHTIKGHPYLAGGVPAEINEAMASLYYRHVARNILLLQRLKKIIAAFRRAQISFILFKGFDLALRVYGDPLLRTQRDLDFIVAAKDFSKAKQILNEMGESSFLDLHKDIVSLKRFEHWSFPPLTIDGFWNRCETIRLEEITVPVLSLEDLFLALAIHFAFHHHFRGLKWFIDFAWLAAHPKLNLDLLEKRAKENHLEGLLDAILIRIRLKTSKTSFVPILTRFDIKPFRYLLRLKLLPKWGQRLRMIQEALFYRGENSKEINIFLKLARGISDSTNPRRLEETISKWYDQLRGVDTWEAHRQTPTSYRLLKRIFKSLPIDSHDVFVDLGSGKGRVLLMAAQFPFKRVIGVERLDSLNAIALKNIKAVKNQSKCRDFSLVTMDAIDFDFPKDVTILFLFDPFPLDVFRKVIENIKKSVEHYPRPLTLIYYDPSFHKELEEQKWLTRVKKIKRIGLEPCYIYAHNVRSASQKVKKLPKFVEKIKNYMEQIHYKNLEPFFSKYYEKLRGIETWKIAALEGLGIDPSKGCYYCPSSYRVLKKVFKELPIKINDVLIDLGSGKGRTLMVAGKFSFKKIIGIDISEELNRMAMKNIGIVKKKLKCRNFEIITIDASQYEMPDEVTMIYLYQPFPLDLFRKVIDSIKKSIRQNPRSLTLIYYFPLYHKELEEHPWLKKVRVYTVGRLNACYIYHYEYTGNFSLFDTLF